MIDIIPAIDLIGGKCVRLTKGDYGQKTVYNDDPVAQAREFEAQGFRRLHVVDLDGAKSKILSTTMCSSVLRMLQGLKSISAVE